MNKVICNSIDFRFVDVPDWVKLETEEKPVYRSEIKQEDAGALKTETITAVTKYDSAVILKEKVRYPVILRMKTNDSTFLVGTPQYPVIAEVSDDKIFDTYSFTCKSEG